MMSLHPSSFDNLSMTFNLDKAVSIWIPYKEGERKQKKKRLREEDKKESKLGNRDSETSSVVKRYKHILWPSETSSGESKAKDVAMISNRKEQDDVEGQMFGEPQNAKDYANLFEFSMHRLEVPPDTKLDSDFVPGPYDVICQRGSPSFKHEGNTAFRKLIAKCYGEYLSCNTKLSKTIAISAIIEKVRRLSPKGGFVKFHKQKDCWVEVGKYKCT